MFKNIIIIIIVLASNSLFAQQLPQVHQASGVVRYNGLPIHENIRVLQTTLDATELLNRNGLQLQDITLKDTKIAAITFLSRDNLKEFTKQKGAGINFGLSLGRLFTRTFYNSTSLQNIRGVSPYALEITGMFKLGEKSFITLRTEYSTSEVFFKLDNKDTNKENFGEIYLEPVVHQQYPDALSETDVDQTVLQTFSDNPAIFNQIGTEFKKLQVSDPQKSQNLAFSCGVEVGRFSLKFQLEKLQAERLQNGYNLYKFEPIHRHYANLQIGTKRMQDTFSIDLETKLMNIGCVNLSLLAGYSRVENRTEFTRQSNSRHDTFESGLGWIDLNSRPIPEIEAMYSKIDDRLIQQNPNRAQDVFRVGVAINIVQPNRILEKRLKKEREERIIYEQEFANEIESAKAELEKAIERANIIMDEAIRKAASEESEQERYWIFSHARTHVELEIEDFPGMEHLEEDYIDEATRSTRERAYNLSRE